MSKLILTIISHALLFIIIYSGASFPKDGNFLLPITELERRLQFEDFDIFKSEDLRKNGSVKRIILRWSDGSYTRAKWKRAPHNGHITNNAPRYEIAAYQLQKLFLDENEYVVPPTVLRSFPLNKYLEFEKSRRQIESTFDNAQCVCFVLAYWLENVSTDNLYDKKRFENDTTYARHLANMNIFSYLIRHVDSNIGNFLISKDPDNPRVFAVDNGMAFDSREGERGYEWRDIRVKRLPRKTVDRLRHVESETLHKILGVVVQYKVQDGQLLFVECAENVDPQKGVRISGDIIQFGLTEREIDDIVKRQQKLIETVDSGKIKIF